MRGAVIAQVTASKSSKYPAGSYVYAAPGWTEQAIVAETDSGMRLLEVPAGGRLTDGLGVLGIYLFSYLPPYPLLEGEQERKIDEKKERLAG